MPSLPELDAPGELPTPPDRNAPFEPFTVLREEVELDFNFREKSVSGIATIWIFLLNDLEEISIDARQCEIDCENVTVDGLKTKAHFSDPYNALVVPSQMQFGALQHHFMRNRMRALIPKSRPETSVRDRDEKYLGCVPADRSLKVSLKPEGTLNKDEPRRLLKIKTARVDKGNAAEERDPSDEAPPGVKISIPFRSKNIRDGLHFVGVDPGDTRHPHVYTRHSIEPGTASCIFPCVDDPKLRHAWTLSIKCPATMGDVLEQPLATKPALENGVNGSRKRKHDNHPQPPQAQSLLSEEDKLLEMTVVCSGTLTGEHVDPQDEKKKVMTFEFNKDAAAQHMGFAIGPFKHVELWSEFRTEEDDEKLGANATKVHAYCLPGREDEVCVTCAPVVQAADFFTLDFAKFPFESYKIVFVEDQVADTVAVTGLSLCSTRLLYPEEFMDTEIEVTRKLVHSLACQYLGIYIIPNECTDSWIIIGMQWFITDVFMRSLCGVNWYKFHIKTLSDKLVELDVNRPSISDLGRYLHVGDFEMEFMALKASLVLFILDQRMVKYAGCAGVSRVVSHFLSTANISSTDMKSTTIGFAEFAKICEKKSHYRPEKFWQQWVFGAGCPKLSIKQKFNKKNLNVDIQISQSQAGSKPLINSDIFWREYQEELHEVWAGHVPKFFSGPITVRIHEADGTPYEHCLDIEQDDKGGTSWSIPYNTKYKRLKKSKRKDAAGGAADKGNKDAQDDDVVYFNMLGDVLQADEEKKRWGLREWSKKTQDEMDGDSYEWIRVDCNFEWLCKIETDMPGYMYTAQLQQDRDVVAHQDALLFFRRTPPHGMISTVEARTLVDKRYFHGIRTMAAADLPKHSTQDLGYWGLGQLVLAFRHFFCYRVAQGGVETYPPLPNDFSDKAQYAVQLAIVSAIARARNAQGRCSVEARNFLLDLIRFNDNSLNEYSDHVWVATLLEALTESLIPVTPIKEGTLYDSLDVYKENDLALKNFIDKTVETIERFRRMDDWTSSYHNIWTTTALDCKMKLMKARVIPTTPLDFLQYCQDENLDLVRIKAYDCLVELGMLSKGPIVKLLLNAMSTDRSPYVRDRLFKAFCRGIAAIGLGDHKPAAPEQTATTPANGTGNVNGDADTDVDADADLELEDDNGGLVIEQGDTLMKQRIADSERREDIGHTLSYLKKELKGNTDLQIGIWKAFESSTLGLKEKQNLLELCAAMFEPEDTLFMTFDYPKYWKCTRQPTTAEKGKKKCIVTFTSHYRTTPRNPRILPPPIPEPTPEIKPPEPKKIKLNSRLSFSGSSVPPGPPSTPGTPAPVVRQGSISVSLPRTPLPSTPAVPSPITIVPAVVASDSISVKRSATPAIAIPPSVPASVGQKPNGHTIKEKKPTKKRPSEERTGSEPPLKKAKSNGPVKSSTPVKNGRPSKIVRVKFTAWDKLSPAVYAKIKAEQADAAVIAAASTIVATPKVRPPPLAPSVSNSSASPTYVESPASVVTTPGSSFQSAAPASQGASQGSGAMKVRKPLPSAKAKARQPSGSPAPAPSKASSPAPAPSKAAGAGIAPPRPKIKLKLKPSAHKQV